MKRIVILLLMVMPVMALYAQRQILVFDPELNQPVRDFKITTENEADSTNMFGEALLREKFDTLILSKPGYMTLRIPAQWVEDSIPVIKDYNNIGEVVVYGNHQDDFQKAVKRWTKADKVEYELRHPITGIEFSLSDILNKKRRREKKNAKRLEKVFKRMDADDSDPIIHSYRSALRIKPKN